MLTALAFPGNEGARLAWEISLGKDMIREVSQALTLEVRQIEANALGRGVRVSTVYIFVVHPDCHRDIHCVFMIGSIRHSTWEKKKPHTNDDAKRGFGGASSTLRK